WRQVVYALAVFLGAWVGQFYDLIGVAFGVSVAVFINFTLMMQLSISVLGFKGSKLTLLVLRYLALGLCLYVVLFLLVEYVRSFHLSDFITLSISFFIYLILMLCTIPFYKQLYGQEGYWLASIARKRYPHRTQS